MKPGAYTMTVSEVGYRRNDAYTAYIGMGSPRQLTRDQVTTLKGQATGKPQRQQSVTVGADGRLHATMPLRENDVYLLQFSRNR